MLVIFSRLEIAAPDRDWIEGIRRLHDPQHALVEAHFTLVFPFNGVSEKVAADHLVTVAAAFPVVRFRLARAGAASDPFDGLVRVFLFPEEGEEALRRLHRRLNAGPLAPMLRPKTPYRPHVTVASLPELREANRVARSCGAFDVPGAVVALDLAEFDGGRLALRRSVPLAG